MLHRRQFALLAPLFAAVGASPASAQAFSTATLLGSWRLEDAVTVDNAGHEADWNGRVRPYSGLIVYEASGLMSVQIASARAPAPAKLAFDELPSQRRLDYLASYYAYFGAFDFDAANSIVRHHVQSSLDPTEIGVTLRRKVSLKNGRLALTTINNPDRPSPTFNRLTWRRV